MVLCDMYPVDCDNTFWLYCALDHPILTTCDESSSLTAIVSITRPVGGVEMLEGVGNMIATVFLFVQTDERGRNDGQIKRWATRRQRAKTRSPFPFMGESCGGKHFGPCGNQGKIAFV